MAFQTKEEYLAEYADGEWSEQELSDSYDQQRLEDTSFWDVLSSNFGLLSENIEKRAATALDLSQGIRDATTISSEDTSWLDKLSATLSLLPEAVGQGVGGKWVGDLARRYTPEPSKIELPIADLVAQATGNPIIQAFTGLSKNAPEDAGKQLMQDAIAEEFRVAEQYPAVGLNKIAQAIPNVGMEMLAALFSGGASIVPSLASNEFSQRYSEFRTKGADRDVAALSSVPSTALAAATAATIPAAFQPGTGLVRGGAVPLVAEGVSAIPQSILEAGGRAYATGEVPTPEELKQEITNRAIANVATASGLAGLGLATNRLRSPIKKSNYYKQLEEMSQVDEILGLPQPNRLRLSAPRDFELPNAENTYTMGESPGKLIGSPIDKEYFQQIEKRAYYQPEILESRPVTKIDNIINVETSPRPLIEVSKTNPRTSEFDLQLKKYQQEAIHYRLPPQKIEEAQANRVRERINLDEKYNQGELTKQEYVNEDVFHDWSTAKQLGFWFKDEKGAININPDILNPRKLLENYGILRAEGVPEIRKSPGQKLFDGDSNIENLFKVINKKFIYPHNIAKKIPEFKPAFDTTISEIERGEENLYRYTTKLVPYYDLLDTSKVDQVLLDVRTLKKPGVIKNVENLRKLGLSPVEIRAVKAVDDTMNLVLEDIRQAQYKSKSDLSPTELDKWKQQVDERIETLRVQDYVPLGRKGDYYISASKNGKDSFYLTGSRREQTKLANKLVKEGYVIEPGDLAKFSGDSVADDIPLSMRAHLASLNPAGLEKLAKDGVQLRGFSKHFLKAELVEGYSKNLRESLTDYLTGGARYVSRLEHEVAHKQAREGLKAYRNNEVLVNYYDKYRSDIYTKSPSASLFRKAMSWKFLAGNPKTATLNLTQQMTMTYPELARHVKNPSKFWLNAQRRATSYTFAQQGSYLGGVLRTLGWKPRGLKSLDPTLLAMLRKAERRGVTSFKEKEELLAIARRGHKKTTEQTVTDIAFAMLSGAERWNRNHAFIAAHDVGVSRGLKGNALYDFAADFTKKTQFIYNKGDRPEILRDGGLQEAMGTFMTFPGNAFSAMKENFMDLPGLKLPTLLAGDHPSARVLRRQIATILMLGGGTALPFADQIRSLLAPSGSDPEFKAREALQEKLGKDWGDTATDLMFYGAPMAAFGINLSGALKLFPSAVNERDSTFTAVAKTLAGTVAQPFDMADTFNYYRKNFPGTTKEKYYRATEAALMPELIRNPSVAVRGLIEGKWTDSRGVDITGQLSNSDIIAKAGGFNVKPLTRAYSRRAALAARQKLEDEIRQRFSHDTFARFLVEGRTEAFQQLVHDMQLYNETRSPDLPPVTINEQSLLQSILKYKNPEAAIIRKTKKTSRSEVSNILNVLDRK